MMRRLECLSLVRLSETGHRLRNHYPYLSIIHGMGKLIKVFKYVYRTAWYPYVDAVKTIQ